MVPLMNPAILLRKDLELYTREIRLLSMKKMILNGTAHTCRHTHATRSPRALFSTSSSSRTSMETGKLLELTRRNPQTSSSICAITLILAIATAIRRTLSLIELMKMEIVKCSPQIHHKPRLLKKSRDRALATQIPSNVDYVSGELAVTIAPQTALACFNLLSMSGAARKLPGTLRASSQLRWLLMTMRLIHAPFTFNSNTPLAALSSTSNQC